MSRIFFLLRTNDVMAHEILGCDVDREELGKGASCGWLPHMYKDRARSQTENFD